MSLEAKIDLLTATLQRNNELLAELASSRLAIGVATAGGTAPTVEAPKKGKAGNTPAPAAAAPEASSATTATDPSAPTDGPTPAAGATTASASEPTDFADLQAELAECEDAAQLRTFSTGTTARRAALPKDLQKTLREAMIAKQAELAKPAEALADSDVKPDEAPLTYDDVRTRVLAMVKACGREKALEVLGQFPIDAKGTGASNGQQLTEDQWPAFVAAADAVLAEVA